MSMLAKPTIIKDGFKFGIDDNYSPLQE